jgi:hypothetical protein
VTQLKLHSPFIITSTLSPGIKIGDSVLHLTDVQVAEDGRDRATFLLVTPEFEYQDDQLRSGTGGFISTVAAFDAFLSFLEAAAEAEEYEVRTGMESDNSDLFPPHIVEWALLNKDEIRIMHSDICNEDGSTNDSLIEE